MGEHDPFNTPEYQASIRDKENRLLNMTKSQASFMSQMAVIPEIKDVTVFENCTDRFDEKNRPPHSIHVVIEGGSARKIARKIFDINPAGIATFGQVSILIITQCGLYEIKFDRLYKLKFYERFAFYLYRKYVKLIWRITNII